MNQMVPPEEFKGAPAYTTSQKLADLLGIGPRAEAARCLRGLDDYLLRDIGLTRGEIDNVTGLHHHR